MDAPPGPRLVNWAWVIESGDYEQRFVNGVAASAASAVEWLKAKYRHPYLVTWDEPTQTDADVVEITGHFEAVLHYSTKHDCTFRIERYALHGEPAA